ncbi:MAG: hypothetical protein E6915_03890 [Streptococcus mitis]|uniref:hypothetical protein n=1 Tax=Streptococcus mitis TaxID=28037 RepID=UPI0021BA9BEF|nr:hypothetical protein [Streptococcus mitis]MDU1405099.1 hypothetical protein [Streptococcus mitis]
MVYVHRFLGQWLDKNHWSDKASVIRRALSIGSGIDEYLKQIEVRRRFTQAVNQDRYFYTVPKEIEIGDTRADRYYRLEMRNYESIAFNTVFYGNGTSIVVKALFEGKGEIVRIYEYETLELLIEDLREEVAITFSCVYKPCYVLASDFEVFQPRLELGKIYCHNPNAPRYRKPIAEVEI